MSVLLGSNDRFGEHAEYDPETRDLVVLPAKTLVRPSAVRGMFSRMLGRTLVLWSDGRVLRFVVDRRELVLEPDVSVHWDEHDGIVVRRAGEELFRWEYESPAREMAAIDPTFMDDQWEDFDFGLYVATRVADVERRIRMFDAGFDPDSFRDRYLALRELAAILGEAFPADADRMMEEIRRWWWRWDTPREQALRSFCTFCDVQCDSHGTSLVRRMQGQPEVGICTRCRTAMIAFAAGTVPDSDRILADATRAVRATGAGHADVLAAELARRKTVASPVARHPPDARARCSGCGTTEHAVARGPDVAFCSRCLSDR